MLGDRWTNMQLQKRKFQIQSTNTNLTMSENITIREATINDIGIIADIVCMAINDSETVDEYFGKEYKNVIETIAKHEMSQYSWKNTLIAEIDGIVAGGVIGYNGKDLEKLRNNTLSIVYELTGKKLNIPDETQEGEFYLDSLGVYPHLRNRGIGSNLINAFCKNVFEQSHNCVGLIVDYTNPLAESIYTKLGFIHVGNKMFFDHKMKHLVKTR